MTEEQLQALEAWIEKIIADRDRASDLHDSLARWEALVDVRRAFGLPVMGGEDEEQADLWRDRALGQWHPGDEA